MNRTQNTNVTATTVPSSSSSGQPTITEYSIRVPKTTKNKHHIMRFNYNLNVDFSQWRQIKLERENNMKEFKATEEDMPKFGAGSEYNRDQKEEARRKKFGIIAKKYNPDAQPWILKVGGKNGKKFRGIREGGVSENAAHFVFTQTKDGSIEAFPLNEWYNFQPMARYKALTAEEAEEEFGRRRKCVNMWTMKMRMKLKNKDEEEPEDPEEVKAAKGSKSGDKKKLQISEMDEWMDSDDMSSSEEEGGEEKKKEEEDSDKEAKSKKKAKGKLLQKKKKKRDVDDEAFEESDDGDEEGRERDYISDSSDTESEPEGKVNKELKSVAEEDALRKLLTSDEDSDEEKSNKDQNESDNENNNKKDEDVPRLTEPTKPAKDSKEKKKEDKKSRMQKFYDAINNGPGTGHASDFSSDSDDSEAEKPAAAAITKKKKKKQQHAESSHNSRSGSPSADAGPSSSGIGNKRKVEIANNSDNSNSPQSTPAKKMKTESAAPLTNFSNYMNSSKDSSGITEEAVRRYLMRKPMTTTELLKKIQSKKTGVSRDELVDMMTQILKKINPTKQTIQGKMYLSIKTPK